MKIIGINGSPRKGGNTEQLINKVFTPLKEAGWETELIQIGGKPIRGCMACGKCFETKNNECVIKNDDLNSIIAKLAETDAIVLGSPVYFANVTAEMKAFIDRVGYTSSANGKLFKGKVGTSVMAVRRAGAIPAFDAMNHFLHHQQLIMPGSTYWNLGIGREKGDIADDAEGLNNMENLGKVIDWLTKATKPALKDFPE